jgi:hypothetical protein
MFSLSDHAFPSRPPLPHLSVNRAPAVRSTPFPAPADPGRKFPRTAAPPRRCPAPRMPPSFYSPPSSLSPLNPLQTECYWALMPSMALKPLTSAINSQPPLPGAPLAPYKRRAPPPEFTAPLPASLCFSPRSSLPLTERHRLSILHHRRPA